MTDWCLRWDRSRRGTQGLGAPWGSNSAQDSRGVLHQEQRALLPVADLDQEAEHPVPRLDPQDTCESNVNGALSFGPQCRTP